MKKEPLISFRNEKESFKNLIELIRNPFAFFRENKSDEKELISFMAFIFRVNLIVIIPLSFLIKLYGGEDFIWLALALILSLISNSIILSLFLIALFIIVILFAKKIVAVFLSFTSNILNFFVRAISGKDDILASKRVIAYTSSISLISWIPIPFIEIATSVLDILLSAIGISKQYRISILKSFIAILAPLIILVLIVLFYLYK